MDFLIWLKTTPIVAALGESDIAFDTILALHSLGLAAAVGLAILLNLRILGFGSGLPLSWFSAARPVFWIGGALLVLSGLVMFAIKGPILIPNSALHKKLIAAVFAFGATALSWRRADKGDRSIARWLSALALLCWWDAIYEGRMIAYAFDYRG